MDPKHRVDQNALAGLRDHIRLQRESRYRKVLLPCPPVHAATLDPTARDVDELLDRLLHDAWTVVVWGHPEGSHTHSWIHYGFHRALEHLGLRSSWLPGSRRDARHLRDVDEAIVITEGQADRRLRKILRPGWIVFGHNCDADWYRERCQFVPLGVDMLDQSGYRNPRWHPEILDTPAPSPPKEPVSPAAAGISILWATDLLPHEIRWTPHRRNALDVVFVGTVWSYNADELERFDSLVAQRGLRWRVYNGVDAVRHEELVRSARFAPALQGAWQTDHGYIPCRLFKNVSYSQLALSNNPSAAKVFGDGEIVCRSSLEELLDEALAAEQDGVVDDMVQAAQQTVRERHTYVRRVRELLAHYIEHGPAPR
jgi:hypothetical protein